MTQITVNNDFESDLESDLSSEEEVAIIIHILVNNCTSTLLLTAHFRVREAEVGQYCKTRRAKAELGLKKVMLEPIVTDLETCNSYIVFVRVMYCHAGQWLKLITSV